MTSFKERSLEFIEYLADLVLNQLSCVDWFEWHVLLPAFRSMTNYPEIVIKVSSKPSFLGLCLQPCSKRDENQKLVLLLLKRLVGLPANVLKINVGDQSVKYWCPV